MADIFSLLELRIVERCTYYGAWLLKMFVQRVKQSGPMISFLHLDMIPQSRSSQVIFWTAIVWHSPIPRINPSSQHSFQSFLQEKRQTILEHFGYHSDVIRKLHCIFWIENFTTATFMNSVFGHKWKSCWIVATTLIWCILFRMTTSKISTDSTLRCIVKIICMGIFGMKTFSL